MNTLQERLTRIHESLEKEVAIYRSKYKDKVKNNKEYLHMLSNDNYSEYSIRDDGSFCTLEPSLPEEGIEQIGQNDANTQSQGYKSKLRLPGGGKWKRKTVTSFLDMQGSTMLAKAIDYIYRNMIMGIKRRSRPPHRNSSLNRLLAINRINLIMKKYSIVNIILTEINLSRKYVHVC